MTTIRHREVQIVKRGDQAGRPSSQDTVVQRLNDEFGGACDNLTECVEENATSVYGGVLIYI